ncbi:MAG: hypothetical protein WC831_00235 [Parcubacteria group bacterium]|jgi:hypothetical protein
MEGENHIFDWTDKIDPKLFSKNYPDKSERKHELKILGLPTYKEIIVNLEEFNSDPDVFLNQVAFAGRPAENYYFTIFPNSIAQNEGGLSTGRQGFSKDQLINFVGEQKINLANHTIMIEPHHKKEYSGTIHVGSNGEICGEFISGKEQSAISRGEVNPEFRIEGRLENLEALHSRSPENPENTTNMQNIFEGSVRRVGEAVKKKFGRRVPTDLDLDFELFYISPGENQELQPIFFDILDHSAAKKDIAMRSRFNVADWRNRTSE